MVCDDHVLLLLADTWMGVWALASEPMEQAVSDELLLDCSWALTRTLLSDSMQHNIGQTGQNLKDLKALGPFSLYTPRSGDLTC